MRGFKCWDPKPQQVVRMIFGSYVTNPVETDAAAVIASFLPHVVCADAEN